ncbi:hypothetical protein EPK99_23250 [Neorhizobium lilium]|uniref:Uncharacterized protein n=1 Tax=Neorhizobium lilium TaxID=2503024 RepID=A0A3S3VHQ6_9HYPH|nr:hypothetical protein [Neorhizobium lilium]RWX74816.1 hypothetical protein EPK99_23250 [Neorhizobium lilium]
MMHSIDAQVELRRLEEACRQTRHQIDLIERQIIRKMTALIPSLGQRRHGHRRGKRLEHEAFLCRYRSNLAAITAECQPDIDALSSKLARQEAAFASFHARISLMHDCAGAGQGTEDDLDSDRSGGRTA